MRKQNACSKPIVKDIVLSKDFCRTKDGNFTPSVTWKIKQECLPFTVRTNEKNNIAADN